MTRSKRHKTFTVKLWNLLLRVILPYNNHNINISAKHWNVVIIREGHEFKS